MGDGRLAGLLIGHGGVDYEMATRQLHWLGIEDPVLGELCKVRGRYFADQVATHLADDLSLVIVDEGHYGRLDAGFAGFKIGHDLQSRRRYIEGHFALHRVSLRPELD